MINMSWVVALSQASDDMMIALDSWPLARITDGQTSQHCLSCLGMVYLGPIADSQLPWVLPQKLNCSPSKTGANNMRIGMSCAEICRDICW